VRAYLDNDVVSAIGKGDVSTSEIRGLEELLALLLISKTNRTQRRGRYFSATYSRSCKLCSMTLITQRLHAAGIVGDHPTGGTVIT
jgi:hypothetical protein